MNSLIKRFTGNLFSTKTPTVSRLMPYLILLGFGVPHAKADSALEAQELLQYFSASCPTQGDWTRKALDYSNNLIETLKTLATDPDCRTLNGALSDIQNLSNVFYSLEQDQNERQILSLKKQEQELLILMTKTTDPNQLEFLTAQIQAIQVQIASFEGLAESDQNFSKTSRKGRALSTLVAGTNSLLQQAVQNSVCLDKHSSVLTGIAGLAGSVQAVTMTGGTSLLAAAGVDLMNNVIEQARARKLARKINRMSSAIAHSAYQCVLEALSNQWCAADDALQIVKLKGDSLTSARSPSKIENGITLLNRDSKIFLNWLESIRSGTEPSNHATAERQALVLDRDKQVRAARVNGLGLIAEKKALFSQIQDVGQQWTFELQLISEIVTKFINPAANILGTATPNPLQDVFGPDAIVIAQWYLIGVTEGKIPFNTVTNSRSRLEQYPWSAIPTLVGDPNFKPNLDHLKQNMLNWVSLAQARVASEFSVVLNLDPLKLITDATTPTLSKHSPYDSLEKVIDFLSTQASNSSVIGSFQHIYDDTVDRLKQIRKSVQDILTDPTGGDPVQALSSIYTSAVLDNGIGFLGDRLVWSLRLSLNQLIKPGQSELNQSQSAALLAANDIMIELGTLGLEPDLNLISRDINNSKVIIQNTIQNFANDFGDGISKALKLFTKNAILLNEDTNGVNNQAAAELCIKLLAVPTWPKQVDPNLCAGRYLNSLFKSGPTSNQWSKDLKMSSYGSRICTFRDYNRKNRLYQEYVDKF